VAVGTDGQPLGPHPHVHILPCPYDRRLDGPIRCIVGASGERMRWVGPCGRPSDVYTPISLFEKYCAVARYYLLVPYRLGRCDATGLPGGEQGTQERGQQGDADDEPQFSPGNAIDQARVKLLEEVDCKDVV
jgi:hypothetical protein